MTGGVFSGESASWAELKVERDYGNSRINVQDLVDIVVRRATIVARLNADGLVDTHIANFNSGRFAELKELYNELKKYV